MASWLGIDYGAKRVGVAIGGESPRVARPFATLPNDEDLLTRLKLLIESEQISELVLGLPRGLDGQETEQTKLVRQFAKQLAALGRPIVWQDEAATTDPRAAEPDQAAATQILQDYLDSL